MAVAAFVISVLAFVTAALATWYTRESSRASARQAVATEDQAESAKAQTDYARRMLELAEEQAVQAQFQEAKSRYVQSVVALQPPPSPWSVSRHGKGGLSLVNGSPRQLFDVSVSFDVDPPRVEPTAWARVDERATVKIMMIAAFGASPDTMKVRWRDEVDSELREWTTALP